MRHTTGRYVIDYSEDAHLFFWPRSLKTVTSIIGQIGQALSDAFPDDPPDRPVRISLTMGGDLRWNDGGHIITVPMSFHRKTWESITRGMLGAALRRSGMADDDETISWYLPPLHRSLRDRMSVWRYWSTFSVQYY